MREAGRNASIWQGLLHAGAVMFESCLLHELLDPRGSPQCRDSSGRDSICWATLKCFVPLWSLYHIYVFPLSSHEGTPYTYSQERIIILGSFLNFDLFIVVVLKVLLALWYLRGWDGAAMAPQQLWQWCSSSPVATVIKWLETYLEVAVVCRVPLFQY